MKTKVSIFFVFSFLILLKSNVWGQLAEKEQTASILKSVTINSMERKENSPGGIVPDLYIKKPITLFFTNGQIVKGFLLANESITTDSIFVEINGKYEIIDLEQLYSFSMDNLLVDKITGRIVSNDLKQRVDNMYISLGQNPNLQSYIVYYYGSEVAKSYPATRKKAVNDHIKMRGLDSNRITQIEGPSCGKTFVIEIWVGNSFPDLICPR